MKGTRLAFDEPRSSKKNLMDRMLLASWVAVYSILLLGFEILKRFERVTEQNKVPKDPGSKSS